MQASLIFVQKLAPRNAVCCLGILILLSIHAPAQTPAASGNSSLPAGSPSAEHDPSVDTPFDHFYNMEYDRSIQEFERIVEKRPSDPAAVNHLLTAVLMRELYRICLLYTSRCV